MKQYANGDQRASFLFFGAPAESEGAVCTKRFRVYRMLMMRYFSGNTFYHYPQQKEHYALKRINGRIKKTEILIIFFVIHTANAVQLARRIAKAELCQAA